MWRGALQKRDNSVPTSAVSANSEARSHVRHAMGGVMTDVGESRFRCIEGACLLSSKSEICTRASALPWCTTQ